MTDRIDPDYDAEFEAFLKRRSPMHRRLSDIDHAEPPADLDTLVLKHAREAIETPEEPPMYRTSRWAMPLGLAATILIAFSVVLNINRHEHPASAPAQSSAATGAARHDANVATDSTAPMLASEKSAAEPRAEAPATLAARTTSEAALSDLERDTTGPRASTGDMTSRAAAAEAAPAAGSAPATAAVSAAEPSPHADADSWLRYIARLRAEGKTTEADRELEAFRRANPRHTGGVSLAEPPTR
jgi:hypothetical protein